MTREEIDKAIKDLELVMFHLDNNSKIKKSYKLAIEALKAEHCEDAIRRQAVLDKIRAEIEVYKSTIDNAISEDELKIEGMKEAYADCIEIIDKYRAESEVQDADSN